MSTQISNQSIYDQTVRHLRSMEGPSRVYAGVDDATACAYRGKEGRRCAVGFWIDDDHYMEAFEGDALPSPTNIPKERHTSRVVLALRFYPTDDQLRLLKRLQEIHDSAYHGARWDLQELHRELKDMMVPFGINTAVLNEFSWR